MSVILVAMLLGLQEAPAQEIPYPDVDLENDPLAPLPDVEEVLEPLSPPPEVARAAACPTRKFESEIEFVGPPARRSSVILCADSDDPADYESMLRSAKREIAFNERFTISSRSALLAAIDAELDALAEQSAASIEGAVPIGR